MFRSARQIDVNATADKLERLRGEWQRTANTWFDGTPRSVEKRLANIDEVIALTQRAVSLSGTRVGNFSMGAMPTLKRQRSELVELRRELTGASWVPPEADSSQHNLDPRDFSSREEWMNAQNESRFGDFGQEYGQQNDYPVPSLHHDMTASRERVLDAARDFVAEQNTNDRAELLVRAQRLVRDRTASWTPEAAHATVRDFVAAVDAVAPRPVRQASRTVTAQVADFDDVLLLS